jgi:hypothetical protein
MLKKSEEPWQEAQCISKCSVFVSVKNRNESEVWSVEQNAHFVCVKRNDSQPALLLNFF